MTLGGKELKLFIYMKFRIWDLVLHNNVSLSKVIYWLIKGDLLLYVTSMTVAGALSVTPVRTYTPTGPTMLQLLLFFL